MRGMKTVTFYTKPDCSLCEKAERILQNVREKIPFSWDVVDITRDEEAFRKYCIDIPVVLVDGVEQARHVIDGEKLTEALSTP